MHHITSFFEKNITLSNAAKWDNVGLLIASNKQDDKTRYLLTIDFTPEVLQECIDKDIRKVISYHPVIFHPLKSIDPFIARIIENNICVFSPHTAMDNLMNLTFLRELQCSDIEIIDGVATGKNKKTIREIINMTKEICNTEMIRMVLSGTDSNDSIPSCIHVGVGSGKFPHLENSLIITGEMSHHDTLKYKKQNTILILEHFRSERWFLKYLRKMMLDEIADADVILSENDKSPIIFV